MFICSVQSGLGSELVPRICVVAHGTDTVTFEVGSSTSSTYGYRWCLPKSCSAISDLTRRRLQYSKSLTARDNTGHNVQAMTFLGSYYLRVNI